MIIFAVLLVSRAFAIDATESEQFSFGGGLALGINTPLSPSSSDVNFKHGAGPSFRAGLGIEYYFAECFAVQLKAAYQYAGLSTSRDDGTEITTDAITLDSPLLLKYTPRGIRIVSQGEYVADALQSYFCRHPQIEQRCTKGGQVHYLTTENPEKFKESAQLFLHEPVEVENITLGGAV